MKIKKIVIGLVLSIIGLPLLLIVTITAWIGILNETNGAIVSSGQDRTYLLHVPARYDPTKPTPLVISLHGAAGWPALQKNTSRWNPVADEEGFIVVYPAGKDIPNIWHVERSKGLEKDVRFIADLIDKLAATYNIDPARIYADGLSNGGGMAFVLSCTMADRIAAVGLVSSAQTLPWNWCTEQRPLPMMMFHGTADPMIPYEGGLPAGAFAPTKFDPNAKPFPKAAEWAANWAQRNRCGANPVESAVAADVTRREYIDCADGAAVVFYTVTGGGHQWPGGKQLPEWAVGPESNSVDATRLLWAFFREHPQRPK